MSLNPFDSQLSRLARYAQQQQNAYVPPLSGLPRILEARKYPAYAEEVERLRQQRMDSRLEWRRKRRDTMAKNRAIAWAWRYAAAVAVLGAIVLFSELARLTVWTLLR